MEPADRSPDAKPKISVCMATWNGAAFINEQLASILRQLANEDEVIIVDDASTDSTREQIRALSDPRLTLIEHAENKGVQKSFAEALAHARGDLIFLSDQDDVWFDTKVSSALKLFGEHPEVDLLVSNAALIGREGEILSQSYYEMRGEFKSGTVSNIARCSYLGCLMVMRQKVIQEVTPFPSSPHVLHDIWIGIASSLLGMKTLFVDERWVYYRRHAGTVTGNGRLGLWKRLRNRLRLMEAICAFYFDRLVHRTK